MCDAKSAKEWLGFERRQRSSVPPPTALDFLGSTRLNAELQPDRWTISGSEGFRRFLFASLWNQAEINNWKSFAESMEAKGDTESWFYFRARAIADGKPDHMPNISELLADPA